MFFYAKIFILRSLILKHHIFKRENHASIIFLSKPSSGNNILHLSFHTEHFKIEKGKRTASTVVYPVLRNRFSVED
jgi:hypothetical protein